MFFGMATITCFFLSDNASENFWKIFLDIWQLLWSIFFLRLTIVEEFSKDLSFVSSINVKTINLRLWIGFWKIFLDIWQLLWSIFFVRLTIIEKFSTDLSFAQNYQSRLLSLLYADVYQYHHWDYSPWWCINPNPRIDGKFISVIRKA